MDYERLQRGGRERYLDRAVLAGRGYVRHGLLGQGTYSDVYCIEDGADGRRYACKVSWRAEMLEREAQVLKEVRHPLYPEFAAFWRAAGLGILLREYVSGRSLEEMLGRRHFSAAQTIRAGLELAAGLMYLHGLGEGLLFRDVKPGNIIVGEDGGLKLIDLGCVCPLGAEVASRAGSPGFAAPEQLRDGGVLSASCDVYGLGKTLEAMLGDGRARQRQAAGEPASGREKRVGHRPGRERMGDTKRIAAGQRGVPDWGAGTGKEAAAHPGGLYGGGAGGAHGGYGSAYGRAAEAFRVGMSGEAQIALITIIPSRLP